MIIVLVKILFSHKSNVNESNNFGETPLLGGKFLINYNKIMKFRPLNDFFLQILLYGFFKY